MTSEQYIPTAADKALAAKARQLAASTPGVVSAEAVVAPDLSGCHRAVTVYHSGTATDAEVCSRLTSPAAASTLFALGLRELKASKVSRYPLFAVVDEADNWRTIGPFKTREAADRAIEDTENGAVVYCRQVRPSEVLPTWSSVADCRSIFDVAQAVDEAVDSQMLFLGAWQPERLCGFVFVDGDDGTLPTADTFADWADTHLRVEIYINEGDE